MLIDKLELGISWALSLVFNHPKVSVSLYIVYAVSCTLFFRDDGTQDPGAIVAAPVIIVIILLVLSLLLTFLDYINDNDHGPSSWG